MQNNIFFLFAECTSHDSLVVPHFAIYFGLSRYKSPRMKRYLIVQMGEEYFQAKEYTKALDHFFHFTWEYRNVKWTTLLHDILKITWKCAFLVG